MRRLRGGADVLIATPGRLLDLYQQNAIRLDRLEVLVLDEADRMLDMGFIHDIRRIIKLLPRSRQTLLFSATFSAEVKELAKGIVRKPVQISVSPPNSTVELVKQKLIPVEKKDKPALLMHLIKHGDWFQVLVFSRTRHGANRLARRLTNRGIETAAIHGDKSQGARTRALAGFKQGKVRVLVATDIAARGIDINQLPHVVNFDLPQVAEDYVHRIGRTGRAGASGEAISLVSHDEFKLLCDIERLIRKVIPREEVAGFEPVNQLPASYIRSNPKKSGKPSRKKRSSRKKATAAKASKDKGTQQAHKERSGSRRKRNRRPQRKRDDGSG